MMDPANSYYYDCYLGRDNALGWKWLFIQGVHDHMRLLCRQGEYP